jgi:hypothetical protein
MGIYKLNCYREGYDDGFQDGKEGKSPDYTDSSVLKVLLSENAINSYIEGYKNGHEEGYKEGKIKREYLIFKIINNMKTVFRFSILMAIITIASVANGYSQNIFFPTKAGIVQIYANKNAKGEVMGYKKQTITNVEGTGNNMSVSYVAEVLDKKQKSSNPPEEALLKVDIKDGMVILDMKQTFFDLGQAKEMQTMMNITGVPMELPSDLQPGQLLKDAEMTMSVNLGIMKMETKMKMTGGKCLAVEDLTVPAGTFKCHKIRQSVYTTVMGNTINALTMSWYASGIGIVKMETYNDKGELKNSIELVEAK